mmetsp:Transcript_35315/g.112368  ORF Transcript_35315/g.112368 Transcript_35315/m.112368 type:complete len:382 (-) Transcript_35315:57-1202(-)
MLFALPLCAFPLKLGGTALHDVGFPAPLQLLLLLPLFLVCRLLGLHLALHTLALVVLQLGEALGLRIDHGVPSLLLLLEYLLFLLLPELQHPLLAGSVLLDLLLLPLLPERIRSLDLLQVLVCLHRLLHGLHGLVSPGPLRIPFAMQVLQCLLPQELALEHAVLDLPEAFLLELRELLLLGPGSDPGEFLLGLLFLHLPLEHLAVVLLLHLQEAVLPNMLQLLELTLQAHLRLALREHVAEHHLAVEGLHAIGLVVQQLVGTVNSCPALVELDLGLLCVDALPLQLLHLQPLLLLLRLLAPAALQSVAPRLGPGLRFRMQGRGTLRLRSEGCSAGGRTHCLPDAVEVGGGDDNPRRGHGRRHLAPAAYLCRCYRTGAGQGW